MCLCTCVSLTSTKQNKKYISKRKLSCCRQAVHSIIVYANFDECVIHSAAMVFIENYYYDSFSLEVGKYEISHTKYGRSLPASFHYTYAFCILHSEMTAYASLLLTKCVQLEVTSNSIVYFRCYDDEFVTQQFTDPFDASLLNYYYYYCFRLDAARYMLSLENAIFPVHHS